MIKISINNIDYIKECHKLYIQEKVEDTLRKYNIFDYNKIKIFNFIKNKIESQLYELILEEINLDILQDLDDEYRILEGKCINDYIDNEDIINLITDLKEYIKYVSSSNGRSEEVKHQRNEKLKCILNGKYDFLQESFNEYDFFGEKLIFNDKIKLNRSVKKLIKFLERVGQIEERNNHGNVNKEKFTLKKVLIDIFNYDNFCRADEKWNRHILMYNFGINVCPYCNRLPITNYLSVEGNEKTTGDLDHFYCQDKYPYLGLSIYNFVPSCSTCNSRYKLNKDFLEQIHLYPYKDSFGDNVKFKTRFDEECDMGYLLGNSINFDLKIERQSSDKSELEKINNSIKTFHLEELYAQEKEYIRNIIRKCNYYNSITIEQLSNFQNLFESKDEIKEMLFGKCFKDEDLVNKPLSKLTKDIYDEFAEVID